MKIVSVILTNGNKIASVMERNHADNVMDQYLDLCSGDIDDNCLELSVIEDQIRETILIPFKNIYYISCREVYE